MEEEEEFTQRVLRAGKAVFGQSESMESTTGPLLLPDSVLDEYGLGAVPLADRKSNSHLSLLSMVDCWHQVCNGSFLFS